MKNLISIGLPSKGRLKEGSIDFLEKNNLKLTSNGGERNYFAKIENYPNIEIIYLHAKEIIQRLGDGTLDLGIGGEGGLASKWHQKLHKLNVTTHAADQCCRAQQKPRVRG